MLIFCLCDTGGRGVLRFSSGLKIDKSAKINCLKTIIIEMSWYLYLFTAKLRNLFSSITASVNRMKLVGDWSHIAIIIEHKYIAKLPSPFSHFLRIWKGGKGGGGAIIFRLSHRDQILANFILQNSVTYSLCSPY